MATSAPEQEEEKKALFGPDYDENKPLHADPSDSKGQSSLTPDEVADREKSFGSSSDSSAEVAEKSGLYSGTEKGGKFSFRGRIKRKTTAWIVAGALGLGGGAFGFSIIQGPLQFVHISQLLKGYHFAGRESESNARTTKIGQYIYALNKDGYGTERVRLGVLGNKYADRIEKRMNKGGIETAYTEKTGYRKGYILDPDKFAGGEMEKYVTRKKNGDIDYDRVQAAVQREFAGYNVSTQLTDDGRVLITSTDEGRFFKSKKLQSFVMNLSGSKASWTQSRVMAKRAGITLHPLKKLDRKLLTKADEAFEKRKERRKNGENTDKTTATTGESADDDGSKSEEDKAREKANADQARDSANSTSDDARSVSEAKASDKPGAYSRFASSTSMKLAGGGAAAVGVACMIKAVADNADDIKETQVILPMMRIAGEFMSLGGQVMDGSDFDMEQLGDAAEQLHAIDSTGKKTSVSQSETMIAESGGTGGVPASETLKTAGKTGSPFDAINSFGIKQALEGACSTVGMAAISIFGFATGPVAFVGGAVLDHVLGISERIINQLADWVSGEALNLTPVGAELGNTLNYGARAMARSQGASSGGRLLTNQESAIKKQNALEQQKEEMSTKNIAYRLFNPYDAHTLTAKVIDSATTSQIASYISNPLANFSSVFNSFIPKTHAASTYDYGFGDVGFSEAELDNPKVDNPYKNASDVITKILPEHSDYIERAKKCMGVAIDPSTYDVTPLTDSNPTFKSANDDDCKDTSEDYLQFRMYVMDTQTMMALACFEADDSNPDDAEGTKACNDLGGSGATSSTNTDSSEDTTSTDPTSTMPSGSAQELAKKIVDSGKVSGDSRYMGQIKAVANGDNSCHVSEKVLGLIVALSEKHTLHISSLNRKCTNQLTASGTGSHHYANGGGRAVDFSMVDGVAMTYSGRAKDIARDVFNEAAQILPKNAELGQINSCGVDGVNTNGITKIVTDACNHIHIGIPD